MSKFKLIAVALAVVMVLAGCGKNTNIKDNNSDTEVTEVFSIKDGITNDMKNLSRVSPNANLARIADVFRRAEAGEELTVGCIGGSITQGSLADENYGYEKMMREWWEKTFPNAKFTFVNAGIGGTDSHFGVYRLQRDLLSYKPDFVTVEFSVNDAHSSINALTYECLVRRILEQENSPAVMLLFMTQEDGTSLVDTHKPIGEYYNLPMISYKDAILSVIDKRDIRWEDISPDNIHPNSDGHRIVSDLISSYFEEEILPNLDTIDDTYEIPAPKTEQYMNAVLVERADENAVNENLKDFAFGSFTENVRCSAFKESWRWDAVDSKNSCDPMVFDVRAKNISMYYSKMVSKGGMVEVKITYDDAGEKITKERTVNADFSNGWGTYTEIVQLFTDTSERDLHIEITPVYNETNTDKNRFSIYAFGIS